MKLKTNSGFLWRNERRANDRQPTHTGKLVLSKELVDAVWEERELQIAAWVNEKDGRRFFSLRVSLPED